MIDPLDSPAPGTAESVGAVLSAEDKKFLTIVYALFALGFFFGISFFIGAMLAHIKKADAGSIVAKEHYRFQIRTFWFSLPWIVVGTISFMFIVGFFILAGIGLWILWRVLKGWTRLSSERGVYSN